MHALINFCFLGKRYVECRGQGLISVPKDIDPETQVLDLSGNDLQNLPREAFARLVRKIKLNLH